MNFAESLKIELGVDRYCALLSQCHPFATEGILVVDASQESAVVMLILCDQLGGECSLWKLVLQDDLVIHMMEVELGIEHDDGIVAYASYFRDALVKGPKLQPLMRTDTGINSGSNKKKELSMSLIYDLSGRTFEGRIKIFQQADKIPHDVYFMMKTCLIHNPVEKITTGVRKVTPSMKATSLFKLSAAAESSSSSSSSTGQPLKASTDVSTMPSTSAAAMAAAVSVPFLRSDLSVLAPYAPMTSLSVATSTGATGTKQEAVGAITDPTAANASPTTASAAAANAVTSSVASTTGSSFPGADVMESTPFRSFPNAGSDPSSSAAVKGTSVTSSTSGSACRNKADGAAGSARTSNNCSSNKVVAKRKIGRMGGTTISLGSRKK